MTYIGRITQMTHVRDDQALGRNGSITVTIVDEGGEYLQIESEDGSIGINPDEWPALRATIDQMMARCVIHGEPAPDHV